MIRRYAFARTSLRCCFSALFGTIAVLILVTESFAFSPAVNDTIDIAAHYTKYEFRIPMRDGVKLYTAVYVPKDTTRDYPFLMLRTPYSCAPYGPDQYPRSLGPGGTYRFAKEGYIFVYQDVRGRFMSEGRFLNMTPHIADKKSPQDVDESSDTYDTVEWLLQNVRHNNGRAGLHGISYPGFYVAASIIDTHPAIKAASPQAAIGDWFIGDDFHHFGTFFLQDAFRFFYSFEHREPNPTPNRGPRFDFGIDDAYTFFLRLGPLRNANIQYFNNKIAFWDSMMTHGTYNKFWQRRNIIPNMKNVTANVMNVMGFFDAEDPYGPVKIYHSIEKNNPDANNIMVMGPWFHGGWVRSGGDKLGNVSFEQRTADYYQENVDIVFFNHHLKDKGEMNLPEVLAFASGSNEWHQLDAWPPPGATPATFYLRENGSLSNEKPAAKEKAGDSYLADPAKPVPYTQEITSRRTREYMDEDQRFASRRPDVLVYQTGELGEDLTLAGPVKVELYVSTTGTDADYVVKVIDVYPDSFPDYRNKYMNVPMGGYQMLVRAEPMRAKFRNSFEKPEALVPGKVTRIAFEMPDIFHTFRKGHRLMVHVQSSWFPISDRNPQKFVDIYSASEADFQQATHTIHRSAQYPSSITIGRLQPAR